jgi:hypothetical protein
LSQSHCHHHAHQVAFSCDLITWIYHPLLLSLNYFANLNFYAFSSTLLLFQHTHILPFFSSLSSTVLQYPLSSSKSAPSVLIYLKNLQPSPSYIFIWYL